MKEFVVVGSGSLYLKVVDGEVAITENLDEATRFTSVSKACSVLNTKVNKQCNDVFKDISLLNI